MERVPWEVLKRRLEQILCRCLKLPFIGHERTLRKNQLLIQIDRMVIQWITCIEYGDIRFWKKISLKVSTSISFEIKFIKCLNITFVWFLGRSVGVPEFSFLRNMAKIRRCAHSDCFALCQLHFQYGGESKRNRQILTDLSVKVRPFLFFVTLVKCNLIYSEYVKVFFVRICRVFYGAQGQTQSPFFSM